MSKHRRDDDPAEPSAESSSEPNADSGAEASAAEAVTARPVLRIVKGDPTPEELAVLLALVSAGSGAAAEAEPVKDHRGGWADPSRLTRQPLRPGRNGWIASR